MRPLVAQTDDCVVHLSELGSDLHVGRMPRVQVGGFVIRDTEPDQSQGKMEKANESPEPTWAARQSGATGRYRTARRTRQAGSAARPWQAGSAASSGGKLTKPWSKEQIGMLGNAYPDLAISSRGSGIWLLYTSGVVRGLGRRARFVVALSTHQGVPPRAWAFWETAVSSLWIGPRHTNWAEGSICAFTPTDGTWRTGDSLITLADLYTIWALCQLHLEKVGFWPGRQSAHLVHERLNESRAGELCGCGQTDSLYVDCCFESDMARQFLPEVQAQTLHRLYDLQRRPPYFLADRPVSGWSQSSLDALPSPDDVAWVLEAERACLGPVP